MESLGGYLGRGLRALAKRKAAPAWLQALSRLGCVKGGPEAARPRARKVNQPGVCRVGGGPLRGGSQRVSHGHQAFNRRFLVVAE